MRLVSFAPLFAEARRRGSPDRHAGDHCLSVDCCKRCVLKSASPDRQREKWRTPRGPWDARVLDRLHLAETALWRQPEIMSCRCGRAARRRNRTQTRAGCWARRREDAMRNRLWPSQRWRRPKHGTAPQRVRRGKPLSLLAASHGVRLSNAPPPRSTCTTVLSTSTSPNSTPAYLFRRASPLVFPLRCGCWVLSSCFPLHVPRLSALRLCFTSSLVSLHVKIFPSSFAQPHHHLPSPRILCARRCRCCPFVGLPSCCVAAPACALAVPGGRTA